MSLETPREYTAPESSVQTEDDPGRPPQAEPRSGSPTAPAAAAVPGAPPSNTAPGNCRDTIGTRVLRCGIDSLYLSYPGDISLESATALKTLKLLAQSKDRDRRKLAQWPAREHVFEVRDRGSFPFEFILVDRWYRLQVAGPNAEGAPLAHVKLASEALTFEGPVAVEQDLRAVVDGLGLVGEPPSVSRVDLCVDFVTDTDIGGIGERQWVTRGRKIDHHSVSRCFSGWSIGIGGALSARLYDKTLELATSGKDYLRQIWADLGWDGEQPVWRLEFQFRREVLRELGITQFGELLERLGGLWQYACTDWLRLTNPSLDDATQSRWPTTPMWQVLRGADWATEAGVSRRTAPKGRLPSDRYLFVNGLSGLICYMAREGITYVPEGVRAFLQAAQAFHEGRRALTELSFDDYVEQRVALKARDYNAFANAPPDGTLHPADQAVADEYRRRSDGA